MRKSKQAPKINIDSTLALTAFACFWAQEIGFDPEQVEIEIIYLEF